MLGPAFTGGCYVVRKGLLSEGTALGASLLTAARRVYTTSRSRYVRCSFRYGLALVSPDPDHAEAQLRSVRFRDDDGIARPQSAEGPEGRWFAGLPVQVPTDDRVAG